jgi:zinc transporter
MDVDLKTDLPQRSASAAVDIDLSDPSAAGGYGVVPGLVWAFRIHEDGTADALAVDKPIENRHDGWLWLHLNLADMRARQWLRTIELPAAAVALLTSYDNHQQLHAADASIYGVFCDLTRNLGETGNEFAHLHFVMTERVLVSGRYRALAAVESVRKIIEQGQCRLPTAAALLELIVEHVADAVDRLADNLAIELDKIEDGLAGGAQKDDRQELRRLRRTCVTLHRQLGGLRTLFHRLENEGTAGLKPMLRLAAGKLSQRLDALDHDIVEFRDRARLLQEEISAATAAQSNRALNILTIITTVILPPTLVTGVFGMNTKGLPFTENPDGFLWALALMLASAIAVYVLMKRIGALKF